EGFRAANNANRSQCSDRESRQQTEGIDFAGNNPSVYPNDNFPAVQRLRKKLEGRYRRQRAGRAIVGGDFNTRGGSATGASARTGRDSQGHCRSLARFGREKCRIETGVRSKRESL